MAAEEGVSSSSLKLAAKAMTTASEMQIPENQEPTEVLAKLNGCAMVGVVMSIVSCAIMSLARG